MQSINLLMVLDFKVTVNLEIIGIQDYELVA